MNKISFFIAGNLKSGTTTYYNLLKQHPEIFLPEYKEPKYFCTDFHKESDEFHGTQVNYPIRTSEQYSNLYEEAENNQILGDCTPHYTYSRNAAQNIYEYNPEAKIIIFLREPVSFLRSLHFDSLHALNETEEDFLKALNLEEERKKGFGIPKKISSPSYLYYSEWIKYKEQIKRYVDRFGFDNLMVILLDEVIEDEQMVYRRILKFLGLRDIDFSPDWEINTNESRELRFERMFKYLKHSWVWNLLKNLVPASKYSILNEMSDKLFFRKAKKKELPDQEIRNLKKRYFDSVCELNSYLNDTQLLKSNILEVWKYEK